MRMGGRQISPKHRTMKPCGWPTCRLAVMAVLLLATTSCLRSQAEPPRNRPAPADPQGNEVMELYVSHLEEELLASNHRMPRAAGDDSAEVAKSPPAAAGHPQQQAPPATGPVPSHLQRLPPHNSTFKVVDGIPEYRIGAGDVLRMTAFVGPETTERLLRVQPDGTVFVPRFQIGRVTVVGLTPTEAAEALMERHREYAPGAHVELEVQEHRAWTATLLGEIRSAGSGDHPLRGRTTVVEFIFDHGGPNEQANLADVRLVREGVEIRLDLMAAMLRGRAEHNPVLDAGDVVFVPSKAIGAGRVFVLGEVRSPGVYTFTEGLTVMDAIAQAGAFTDDADPARTFIARYEAGEQKVLGIDVGKIITAADMSRNLAVRQGDFIVVPTRSPARFIPFFDKLLRVTRFIIDLILIARI